MSLEAPKSSSEKVSKKKSGVLAAGALGIALASSPIPAHTSETHLDPALQIQSDFTELQKQKEQQDVVNRIPDTTLTWHVPPEPRPSGAPATPSLP